MNDNSYTDLFPSSVVSTQEEREIISQFCLMDDIYMRAFFRDNILCTQYVLRIIMDKPDLEVIDVKTQEDLANLKGRSIELDILAKDKSGKYYNIEVQNDKDEAIPRRARYHSSLVDANISEKGSKFKNLPDTYIIFITKDDILGLNQQLYTIRRYIEGTSIRFDDGETIIYVNGSKEEDSDVGRLVHDFKAKNVDDMTQSPLKDYTKQFKYSQKGELSMSATLQDFQKRSELKAKKEVAKNLINMGELTFEQILSAFKFTEEELNELYEECNIEPKHRGLLD